MADTTFVTSTPIVKEWLNDVNDLVYNFTQSGTGAVARRSQDKMRERVSVKDFGAVCDGMTDDSAAVQLAVNECLSFNPPKDLGVPGKCRLASSVNIDRLVDTTTAEFTIFGEGEGAGFYTTGNVTLFDSTISVTTDPKSEFVTFQNIHFETNASANLSYVMSQKFLRSKFINCLFQRIRCVTASIYIQTWHFICCNIRNQTGYFITCKGLYDIDFDASAIENSGRLVDCIDTSNTKGALGLRIRGGVVEGITDTFLNLRGAQSLDILGVHMEANFSPWINVNNVGTMTSSTINLIGNVCVCSSGTDVVMYYGATSKVTSIGNTVFTGQLHNNCVQVEDIVSIGDKALTGGTIHDNTSVSYSTINGVERIGTTNKAWTDSSNQITKDTSGNFGLGIAAQSSARLICFGSDSTSSNYALRLFNSGGNTIADFRNDRSIIIPALQNAVNDAAAAGLGVPVGGLYRNGSIMMYRVT